MASQQLANGISGTLQDTFLYQKAKKKKEEKQFWK